MAGMIYCFLPTRNSNLMPTRYRGRGVEWSGDKWNRRGGVFSICDTINDHTHTHRSRKRTSREYLICKLSTAAHLSPMQSEFWKLLDWSSHYFRLNATKLMVQKSFIPQVETAPLPRAFDKSSVQIVSSSHSGCNAYIILL